MATPPQISGLVKPGSMNLTGETPPMDLQAEAKASSKGGTTLLPQEWAAFQKVRDAYLLTGNGDKKSHDAFIKALTGSDVTAKVQQRLLYNAAHGPADHKAGLAADILAYYPNAKNLKFTTADTIYGPRETVDFSHLVSKQRILGAGSDYDIPQWPPSQIQKVQQTAEKISQTLPRQEHFKGQGRY